VLRIQRIVDSLCRKVDTESAKELVRRQCGSTQDFGETTGRQSSVEFHLPQAILGMRVAKREVGVVLAAGDYRRNPLLVAPNFNATGDSLHTHGTLMDRLTRLPVPKQPSEREEGQRQTAPPNPAQYAHCDSEEVKTCELCVKALSTSGPSGPSQRKHAGSVN
jgi:hypothetical protein